MALKVPLDLDERMIEKHLPRPKWGETPKADDDAVILRDATRAAREAAANIVALEAAMTSDKTRQTHEAALLVADAAKRTGIQIAERLDAARARVTGTIERIEKLTSAPPPPINALQIANEAEIRAALKGMGEKERTDTINDAFATGKMNIIAAVLHGDAFLSGLGPAKQASLRHRYQTTYHAGEAERRQMLTKMLEAFDRAGTGFTRLVNDAADTPAIRMAAANKRAADEALAVTMQRT